ncbi:hypothetical protein Aph01nite_41070 [Acrocarpospora phusangensis]|uniref:Peptidase M48 domain-containing protein n=1 Tax=Acrocarpospora phusangensis TaxID=1070424 RepID=A0A919QGI2_9ACTN|nr:M56 family metallopeptidase [Acrocarpospora phusangensis]GIH25797.1 hypothetical protein Aph01nite_41070 [Acrocarpospora phusangensis]
MTPWLIAAGAAPLPILFGGRLAAVLAGARWTREHPRAALALWQAAALAGGLGVVGAGLVAAVAPLAAAFPHSLHTLARHLLTGRGLAGMSAAHIAVFVCSVALVPWLVANTVTARLKAAAEQRRQRLLLDVLADHSEEHDAYVLPVTRPVAYCVPGTAARVVLSRGTLDLLDHGQLQAVLAHERAHLRGRHDLLLLPFIALARAFPWLPAARRAREAVPVLLELLADDQARRAHGSLELAHAIVRLSAVREPVPGVMELAGRAAAERVERLLSGVRPRSRWVSPAVYLVGCALLSGPVAILVAPLLCP